MFVREGAIVPRGDILRANNNWTTDWKPRLRIEVFPAERDTSRSFSYFTGSATETITARTEGRTVTVSLGDLALPGVIELQLARAGKVSRDGTTLQRGTDYEVDPDQRIVRIPFDGATTLVVEDAVSIFAQAPSLPTAPPSAAGPSGGDGRGCAYGSRSTASLAPALFLLLLVRFTRRRLRTRA